LQFVSYRGLGKGAIKGGREKNTKSILWGMWNIDKSKPVVITEGQPDAMVVWQSGYKNVVSVPSGASDTSWINHCWDWLQDINEFIVFADNDNEGLKMAKNIKSKLHNVKIVQADRKDANEVLFYEGEKEVYKIIDKAINETPAGLLDLAEVEYQTAMVESESTIETGFLEYDRHVEDWKMKELTVITGRNEEMSETKIQDWLYRKMIGNKKEHLRTIITKYRDKVEPKPEIVQKIKEWHKGKLYLYDRNEEEITGNLDKFFEVMELAAKRYG